MNRESDAERFDRIRRSTQFGITIKDLVWLVRLVEKLEKLVPTEDEKKTEKITFNLIKEDDGKYGVECSACGDRFFDLKSKGVRPRLLTSCIELAVAHAKEKHDSLRSELPSAAANRKSQ
jgi:hypothetical protein